MYAIFAIASQKQICAHPALRSPTAAWNHFRDHYFESVRRLGDGTVLDWHTKEHRKHFECRLIGFRAPVLKLLGHRLDVVRISDNWPWEYNGTCTCGWTLNRSVKGELQQEYRVHLEGLVDGAEMAPRAAENLSAGERVEKSLGKLKAAGGGRKTFRLHQSAVKELDRMVAEENHPNHTAAIEAMLVHRPRLESSGVALYPIHVDDTKVDSIVDNAVSLACRELDQLFPGVAPDGGKGISSNFQGLLVEHIKAMLTGQNQARRSHHTHLPALLADDNVFGASFSLPAVQGAGYVVLSPTTSRALSAYSGKFYPVFGGRVPLYQNETRLVPLFGEGFEGKVTPDAHVSAYSGRPMFFKNEDADILYSTHEGAVTAALAALEDEESSPAAQPLKVVAAVYDGARNCFIIL